MGISVPFLVIIICLANFIVGRLIVGKERRKIYETDGKYIHIAGLIMIGIVGIWILYDLLDNAQVMKWFWLLFLTLTVGFQSLMEWKFLKGSKEYIVSLIVLLIGLIYILVFMF